MNKNVIVNSELNNLIPPLTPDEYNGLEMSIIADGCRDALILWNDTLVDGHNRYEICIKHNIELKTVQKDFKNINDVKIWVIDNQKSRRNLSDGWKYELAQTKKAILLLIGKEKQKETLKKGDIFPVLSTIDKTGVAPSIDKTKKHNTQNEIANELGWSNGKVAMV